MHWTQHRALQAIALHGHHQLDDQMDEAIAMASVCPTPGCPQLQPCTLHQRNPVLTRNPRRNLPQHQAWARAIKKRDRYTCQRCGANGPNVKLDAHHTSPTQGVTLCNTCHVEIDPHARKR